MNKKALIIYGSTTGLTEICSEEVENGLKEAGVEVERKNVIDANIGDLDNYEYIILGSSTWDYGCLQYDFEDFHSVMSEVDLSGKKFTIFGTGDKSYGETYCLALKTLSDTVEKQGGNLFYKNLDIESDLTDERLQMVKDWGQEIGKNISNT